jgi:hypothetical protein
MTYAYDASISEMVRRLAGAVSKLASHAQSIRDRHSAQFGLQPANCLGVIATYGKLYRQTAHSFAKQSSIV